MPLFLYIKYQYRNYTTNSTRPGNYPGESKEAQYAEVAFLGQVPVKVIGKVSSGDYIIDSGRDDGTGIAIAPEEMTAKQAKRVIGKALESANSQGEKKVEAMIGTETQAEVLKSELSEQAQRIDNLEERVESLEAGMSQKQASTQTTVLDVLLDYAPVLVGLLFLGYALHQRQQLIALQK